MGQISLFPNPATKEGGRPYSEGSTRKQVPYMGSKQGENENQCTLKQDQYKRGTNTSANAASGNQKPYMVVSYVKGLSESL